MDTVLQPEVTEEFLTIEDARGRTLPYVFRPGADPAACRTLIVLHGHGANKVPAKFVSPDWNVVCPLDRYGFEQNGTWWLGEGGDFFVADLLHALVARIRRDTGGDQGLYFWGSSMGGYGAFLHGLLLGADGAFAHIPQIRLRGTAYSDNPIQRQFFDAVLGERDHPYVDLGALLKQFAPRESPVFFLSQNRFDHPRYIDQHCLYFVQQCTRLGFNFHLEVHPKRGHKLYTKISQTIALFDRYRPDITEWKHPTS